MPWSLLAPDSTRERTNSRSPHSELLQTMVLLHDLWCLGLCWHQTQPEIGQLQDDHSELLQAMALLLHPWCLGVCWHQTQPEIGQLQGAHSELLCEEPLPRRKSRSHVFTDRSRCQTTLVLCRTCFIVQGSFAPASISNDMQSKLPAKALPHTGASLFVAHSTLGFRGWSRFDRRSRFDCHPVGSCIEGSVVGRVGCHAFAPSAVLTR